jgi:diketogulonate reductase-like aldo/keto reductase
MPASAASSSRLLQLCAALLSCFLLLLPALLWSGKQPANDPPRWFSAPPVEHEADDTLPSGDSDRKAGREATSGGTPRHQQTPDRPPNPSASHSGQLDELPMDVPTHTLSNGVVMPVMVYGTYGDSLGWMHKEAKAAAGVQDWLALGGRGFDTGLSYGTIASVGASLRNKSVVNVPRSGLFLQAKCRSDRGQGAIFACLNRTLEGLQSSYIDLLLIHFPVVPVPHARTFDAIDCVVGLEDCGVRSAQQKQRRVASLSRSLQAAWQEAVAIYSLGRARAIGLSDTPLEVIRELVASLSSRPPPRRIVPHLLQYAWSPATHDVELFEYCDTHGIRTQAFGALGGRRHPWYTMPEPLDGSHSWKDYFSYANVRDDVTLQRIAAARGVSTATVALAWAIRSRRLVWLSRVDESNKVIEWHLTPYAVNDEEAEQWSSVAIGSTSKAHMRADIQALHTSLTWQELGEIQRAFDGKFKVPASASTRVYEGEQRLVGGRPLASNDVGPRG